MKRGDVGAALLTALRIALESELPQLSCLIPGANENALAMAIAHGMRIAFPLVLMSNQPIGDWSRYMPRNPGFM